MTAPRPGVYLLAMSAASRLRLLGSVLVLASCGKHPATEPQASAASSAHAVPSALRSASASAVAVPSDPPPLPAGCFDGLSAETPEALLKQLGQRCAPGTQPLWPSPKLLKIADGTPGSATLHITDPSRCLRAAAIGPAGAAVTLKLLGPDGELVSRVALRARLGVLNPGGPICVQSAGDYQLTVELSVAGDVLLQAWLPAVP